MTDEELKQFIFTNYDKRYVDRSKLIESLETALADLKQPTVTFTPPKREPLSDDEMRAIWKEGIRCEIPFVEIGRAIEKAHGIGVDDE